MLRVMAVLVSLVCVGGAPARAQGPATPPTWPAWEARLPARHDAGATDSLRQPVGYQHWRGAAIGASAGALVGFLVVLLYDVNCADCDEPHRPLLKGALAGAGLGAAVGFVVGLSSPRYSSAAP